MNTSSLLKQKKQLGNKPKQGSVTTNIKLTTLPENDKNNFLKEKQGWWKFEKEGTIRWYKLFSLKAFYECVDNPEIDIVILGSHFFDYFMNHYLRKFPNRKIKYHEDNKIWPIEMRIMYNGSQIKLKRSEYQGRMIKKKVVSAGRPKKIHGSRLHIIKQYLQEGISKPNIAKILHISLATLYRILSKHKDFFDH